MKSRPAAEWPTGIGAFVAMGVKEVTEVVSKDAPFSVSSLKANQSLVYQVAIRRSLGIFNPSYGAPKGKGRSRSAYHLATSSSLPTHVGLGS